MKTSAILLSFMFCCAGAASGAPVISEFMASNDTTIADEDGEFADWIEIYNPGPGAVDLTGWHLTDDEAVPTQWTFPAVSVPEGGYLVVFASKKNRAVTGSELHTNFKLSAGGEYLALVMPDGVTKSTEFNLYPAQITDISYGLPQQSLVAETVVDEGADLRYHVPTGPVADWNSAAFDDSTWSAAVSGVGYERSAGNEFDPFITTDIESDTYGVHTSIYLRYLFDLADKAAVQEMRLHTICDDGFVAYLNGQLLVSQNAPSPANWDSAALASETDPNTFDSWDISEHLASLRDGTNVLAIHLLNHKTTSSDLLMLPKLDLLRAADTTPDAYSYFVEPTPGSVNNTEPGLPSGDVTVSVPSGVKSGAISVTLSTPAVDAEIRYTLDGTDPDESSALYSGPLAISDPVQLRARAYEPDKTGGRVAKGDYSFLDASLLEYASDVPVIVMDNFGAGAYPNKGRSADGNNVVKLPWQGNVVSFYDVAGNGLPFSQSPSLESRTGCRVRGSSSSTFPRKSLSVEFWDDNDDDNDTISPLGMPAEADWALYAPYQNYDRTLLHNFVSFEFGKLIGAAAPESRVVVVFQNKDGGKIGLNDLAGVYVLMEKVERNRIGTDFEEMSADGMSGGWMIEIDRLDSIPVGMPADTVQPNFHCAGPNGILEIPDDVDGDSSPQSEDDISTYYHSFLNFAEPDGYEILPDQRNQVQTRVRAMDAMMWSAGFGNQETGYPAVIDVDSWVRYYLVHNFSRNQDAIVLSTRIFQRTPGAKIEMGPLWDFDRAYAFQGSASAHPLWASDRDWYAALFGDSNFRQSHQDAWQEARRTTITDDALRALVDRGAAGLKQDQIEASGVSYSTWLSELEIMKDWMVTRARYLDAQYEPLPTVSPTQREFSDSVSVTMAPLDGGVVYFTTDGSDPRAWGGAVAAGASVYSSPLVVTQRTRVVARTYDGGRWSGKVVQDYYQAAELPELVVSEVAYHPGAPTADEVAAGYSSDDGFEYVEFQNIGAGAVDLSVLALGGGVSFDFAQGSQAQLAPGGRVLVVANRSAFETRHGTGHPVAGEYVGTLSNSSDQIVLRDSHLGFEYQNFTYQDSAPWPESADGAGYSLVLKEPESNPDHTVAENWRGSQMPNGNPGATDARAAFTGTASADNDGDGVSALVEHFLGTSDSVATEGMNRMTVGQALVSELGEVFPTLEVRYQIGADDVIGHVEWSSTLDGWDAGDAYLLLLSDTPNGDGSATQVWRSVRPLEQAPQFFRVKVLER
ncbi:CotH kinase family protein [Sulfuriroseicoccus oceanibius]|uniref:CotH kinase family protein n=1 Tax=Sulfuriroseicoccus oceanibius TaxID=2707525 RepID=A0A7T7JBP7_9BACT|nr:CotH kinase family protein [Sulfuriroseicoccus oceanibius]QQL44186.1 CotH kinase family protein [Sulfuriroseicoccus oceanibius]